MLDHTDLLTDADGWSQVYTERGRLDSAIQQSPPEVPQKPSIPMLQENNVRKGFIECDEFGALRGIAKRGTPCGDVRLRYRMAKAANSGADLA